MGYIRHHAIIVTSWNKALAEQAHTRATELFPVVTPIVWNDVGMATNTDYYTFLIPPDGSNEDWPTSDHFDERRDQFIAWMKTERYEDGSTALRWVEVQYGDDEGESVVTRHSDEWDLIDE